MDRDNSQFTVVSLYLISAILALTIIIEAVHITPTLAQTTGSYIEVSRIINIPKNMPNSSNSLPNSNPSLPEGIINGNVISPVVNSYQQVSLMFL
jgi:hypothetical protein